MRDLRGAEGLPAAHQVLFVWGATIAGATYDAATKWPAAFRPREHGAIHTPQPTEVVPAALDGGEVAPAEAPGELEAGD